MTRKHFVAIAEAIATIKGDKERKRVAKMMADICAATNPLFDRGRFYAACNVGGPQPLDTWR